MKTWQRPAAVGQEFAANDYVSACTLQIMCSCELPNGADSVRVPKGNTVDFDGNGKIESINEGFQPCGKMHKANIDTEFFYYEFSDGWTPSGTTVTFDTPVKLAYWRERDDSGNTVNVHITSPENIVNAEANKS